MSALTSDRYLYLNKDRYVGWFDSGVKQGQGTYYYHNGDRYQGEFRQGRRGGFGIFYFAKGPGGPWKLC